MQGPTADLLALGRFYGGVKLGAGGLVRAYGGAARDCLRAAARQRVTPRLGLQLQASRSWGTALQQPLCAVAVLALCSTIEGTSACL